MFDQVTPEKEKHIHDFGSAMIDADGDWTNFITAAFSLTLSG
jgi:hypothetical protein